MGLGISFQCCHFLTPQTSQGTTGGLTLIISMTALSIAVFIAMFLAFVHIRVVQLWGFVLFPF